MIDTFNELTSIAMSQYARADKGLVYASADGVRCDDSPCLTSAHDMACTSAIFDSTVNASPVSLSGPVAKLVMPMECKTALRTVAGKLLLENYESGRLRSTRTLMPEISTINVHGTAVIMTFSDGTKTVATLHKEDMKENGELNVEQGISICLTKKLLGENGSSVYNKLINHALKVKAANEARAEREAADKKLRTEKRENYRRKKIARKARLREEKIELMKEAYLRALTESGSN